MLIELTRIYDHSDARATWVVWARQIVALAEPGPPPAGMPETPGTYIDVIGGSRFHVAENMAEVREKWEKALGPEIAGTVATRLADCQNGM